MRPAALLLFLCVLLGSSASGAVPVAVVAVSDEAVSSEQFDSPVGYAFTHAIKEALDAFSEYTGVVCSSDLSSAGPAAIDDLALHVRGVWSLEGSLSGSPDALGVSLTLTGLGTSPRAPVSYFADSLTIEQALRGALGWLVRTATGADRTGGVLGRWLDGAFPSTVEGLVAWATGSANGWTFPLALASSLPDDRVTLLSDAFPGHRGIRLPDEMPGSAENMADAVEEFVSACAEQGADPAVAATSAQIECADAYAALTGTVGLTLAQMVGEMREDTLGDGAWQGGKAIANRAVAELESALFAHDARWLDQRRPLPDLDEDPKAVAGCLLRMARALAGTGVADETGHKGPPDFRVLLRALDEVMAQGGLATGWDRLLDALKGWCEHVSVLFDVFAGREPVVGWSAFARLPLGLAFARVLRTGDEYGVPDLEGVLRALSDVRPTELGADERAGYLGWLCDTEMACGRFDEALENSRSGVAQGIDVPRFLVVAYDAHLCLGDRESAYGAAKLLADKASDEEGRQTWTDCAEQLRQRDAPDRLPLVFDRVMDDETQPGGKVGWLGLTLDDVGITIVPRPDEPGRLSLCVWADGEEDVTFSVSERVRVVLGDGSVVPLEYEPDLAVAASDEEAAEIELGPSDTSSAPSRLLLLRLSPDQTDNDNGHWISIPFRAAGGFALR